MNHPHDRLEHLTQETLTKAFEGQAADPRTKAARETVANFFGGEDEPSEWKTSGPLPPQQGKELEAAFHLHPDFEYQPRGVLGYRHNPSTGEETGAFVSRKTGHEVVFRHIVPSQEDFTPSGWVAAIIPESIKRPHSLFTYHPK